MLTLNDVTCKVKKPTLEAIPMTTQTAGPDVEVAVIGSGFSGLCMAIKLQEAGIADFVILEKEPVFGGTWRVNHYPGAACDVPTTKKSHLSFQFLDSDVFETGTGTITVFRRSTFFATLRNQTSV